MDAEYAKKLFRKIGVPALFLLVLYVAFDNYAHYFAGFICFMLGEFRARGFKNPKKGNKTDLLPNEEDKNGN